MARGFQLRVAFVALLVRPAHVFLVPARPLRNAPIVAPARTPLRVSHLVAQDADPYRTLGISEDANYDEISNAYEDLATRYAGDTAMMGQLDQAKDAVVNNMLARRMAGQAANYAGGTAAEDIKLPPPTPLLEQLNDFRKKVIIPPTPKYALQVIGLLGGLALAAWISPSSASTIGLLNTASGLGFIYNRGEPDVVRDDFGQVGEVKPMKPKPFALTAALVGGAWLVAFLRTNAIMAGMPARPPKPFATIMRTTIYSMLIIPAALFVRAQGFFPND